MEKIIQIRIIDVLLTVVNLYRHGSGRHGFVSKASFYPFTTPTSATTSTASSPSFSG